ncbi:MAG: endopeptidase La [Bacilli bacterium]|nr:endopeptidase La [Bacilli bacterium]
MFTSKEKIQAKLPAISLRGIVPLPNNEVRFEVSDPAGLKALKEAEQYQNYIVILVPKNPVNASFDIANMNEFGIVGKIMINMNVPNNVRRVKLQGIVRCQIHEVLQTTPHILVDFETMPSTTKEPDKEYPLLNLVANELTDENNKISFENKAAIETLSKGLTSDELADILAYNLKNDYNAKLRYLNEVDVCVRLQNILEDLKRQKFYLEIENQIDQEVKRSINESQKEYYLREKMKAIQEELGDKAKKESDIEALRTKINESSMSEAMRTKITAELNRYATVPANSAESGIIRTYIDFVLSLPWGNESEDCDNIAEAKKILDEDHYGLDKVKDRILEYLAVKIMMKKNPQTILCLVGPPGVGKTSLAKSVARALNKKFVKQALGGVKDESEIRGHRRTYIGALPGRILQGMVKATTNNPVYLLDEIDKMSSDYKGDPTSAMLEVLDSEQNRYFSDHYLEEPYDLSKVFFIATANYLGNIPAPLRDRLEIVEVSSYTEFEKFEITRHHLIDKQLKLHGLSKDIFSISDQAIYMIIQNYTRESGVRELERLIGAVIRKSIKKILMDNLKRVDITVDNLEEYLGKEKYSPTKAGEKDQIGVVTGLAYTAYGGDTLSIEVTYYKGKGGLVLTGKLGDVMKESAQAALSYVKTNAEKFGIDFNKFNENDIHIHVPEGAIPKDGPSAGVTIATAIISAFSNREVRHDVGMTGEITLRGNVLPIGGVREKSIAAHRVGLTKILIPEENLKNLDEVPTSVKNSMEILPIKTIDEAIKYALK